MTQRMLQALWPALLLLALSAPTFCRAGSPDKDREREGGASLAWQPHGTAWVPREGTHTPTPPRLEPQRLGFQSKMRSHAGTSTAAKRTVPSCPQARSWCASATASQTGRRSRPWVTWRGGTTPSPPTCGPAWCWTSTCVCGRCEHEHARDEKGWGIPPIASALAAPAQQPASKCRYSVLSAGAGWPPVAPCAAPPHAPPP